MRSFIYRLSWDKDFRWKFLKRSAICSVTVSCLFAIVLVVSVNLLYRGENEPSLINIEEDDGDSYDLQFEEKNKDVVDKNQSGSINNQASQNIPVKEESNRNVSNNRDIYIPSDEGGHEHNWYVVVDSYPWDESIWVQVGIEYICNACGYVTLDSNDANNHSNSTGHKFRSNALMEERIIHHDGSSHEECSCGARR